jgi:prepilin signal peptidase PulO-like enzyme (type II secretory pathway)
VVIFFIEKTPYSGTSIAAALLSIETEEAADRLTVPVFARLIYISEPLGQLTVLSALTDAVTGVVLVNLIYRFKSHKLKTLVVLLSSTTLLSVKL